VLIEFCLKINVNVYIKKIECFDSFNNPTRIARDVRMIDTLAGVE